jgi:lipid-A-disaccharide synthase-like uncharacterized protein
MSELLLIYMAFVVIGQTSGGANPLPDFMPFAQNRILWKCIGFSGIGVFGTRFLVQWVYSERHKESRIPVIFWWQSLIGTFLCLAYFLRQQDSVGIVGYLFNIVPYSRNLVLVYRKKRRERAGLAGVGAGGAADE